MGSDYGVLCTNYLVSVCVQWLILKHISETLPVCPQAQSSGGTCLVGSNRQSCHQSPVQWLRVAVDNDLFLFSHKMVRWHTSKVGSHTKWSCPCTCYDGIHIHIFIYLFILNLRTRWRLSVKHHVPDNTTIGKHPPVIPEEQIGWTPVLFWIVCSRNKFLPSAWNCHKIPWASNV